MQQHLIVPGEVSLLARKISKHIDTSKIDTYIREAEDIDVRPALGDALYLDVLKQPDSYIKLLDGGTYTHNEKTGYLTGLRTAIAYFVYSRLVKNGDGNVTRFGYVNKDDDNSDKADRRERIAESNEAYDIANRYLKECVKYCVDTKMPLYQGDGNISSNRIVYRVIGE